MSYSGYSYPPYYQQSQQPVNRSTPAQPDQRSTNSPYYRSPEEVPVQPAQRNFAGSTQYPRQPSSDNHTGGYSYSAYRPSNSTADAADLSTRSGTQPSSTYFDTNSRSYVDTSALGSLAYASAMGRSSPSVDQSHDIQRRETYVTATTSPTHVSSGDAMKGYSQPRSDSRGSNGTNSSKAQSNPINPYATTITANPPVQTQTSAHRASPQTQYRPQQETYRVAQYAAHTNTQANESTSSAYAPNQQIRTSLNAANSINPVSSNSRLTSESAPAHASGNNRQGPGPSYGYGRSVAGSGHRSSVPALNKLPALQRPEYPATSSGSANESHAIGHVQSNSNHSRTSSKDSKIVQGPAQPSNVATGASVYSSTGPQHREERSGMQHGTEQYPVTVDPSQVFNQYEYQRRKAEADTKNARKAAELTKAQMAREQQASQFNDSAAPVQMDHQRRAHIAGAATGPQAKQSRAESGSKEQIEAEIKAMIEKMREYKAKDPALFSEVWEQFKKVQPPPQATSQAPQTVKASLTASSSTAQGSGIASPGFMENGPLPSPSPTLNQLATISDHASENLPDLGKFPLLRWRKGKNDQRKSKDSERDSDGHMHQDFGGSEMGARQPVMIGSPSVLQSAMSLVQTGRAVPNGPSEETMRHAVHVFHGATGLDKQQVRFREDLPGSSNQNKESGNLVSQVSRGTAWPENKKISLAAVAKRALESKPVNAGKTISADEIHRMLDDNPSYDQLCIVLESKGFVLERAEFARALLSALPDASGTEENPNSTPMSAKKSSRRKSDDSPRRPRGRPRKYVLPPQQHQGDQVHKPQLSDPSKPPMVNIDIHGSYHVPQGYSMVSGASYRPPTTTDGTVQDPQDQNLAAALQSAIAQIDGQSSNQMANNGRALNNVYLTLNNADGVPINGILKWDKQHQISAESFIKSSEVAPLTGNLINGSHPGFGDSEYGGGSKASPIRTNSHSHPQPGGVSSVKKPLTKEQMARKRDFNEIVDLTQESDDELAYQRKRARLFLDFLKSQTKSGTISQEDEIPTAQQNPNATPVVSGVPFSLPEVLKESDLSSISTKDKAALQPNTPMLTAKPMTDLSRFKATTGGVSSEREALRSAMVVQELNKNDAVKRSTYSIKTLARDILISKGIHPTERPLNWHLEGLRSKFRAVTNTSDLSTFRWDLVDPGGPDLRAPADAEADAQDADDEADGLQNIDEAAPSSAGPRSLAVSISEGNPHREGGKTSASIIPAPPSLTKSEISTSNLKLLRSIHGRRRGRPPGPRGLARLQQQALQAAAASSEGEGGLVRNVKPTRGSRGAPRGSSHLQPLNSHLHRHANEAPLDIDNNSHIVRMSPPLKASLGSVVSATNKDGFSSKVADSITQEDLEGKAGTSGTLSPRAYGSFTTSLAVRVPSFTPSPNQTQDNSLKKRGRPPGSGHKSSIPEPGHDKSPVEGNEPRRRGRPPGSKTGTPNRGRPSVLKRPVSYRTEIPDDGVGVMLPSRSPSTSSQALSHVENAPEKRSKSKPSRRATLPSFQVFKCRWQGCVAELHNMETLRKHVFKLHVKRVAEDKSDGFEAINPRIPCLWLGCEQDGVFGISTGTPKFGSQDSLKEHIDKKHLAAVAWELGDGPSTHPSGTPSD